MIGAFSHAQQPCACSGCQEYYRTVTARVAALEKACRAADELAEATTNLAIIESTEGHNAMIIGEQSLRSALLVYRAARRLSCE